MPSDYDQRVTALAELTQIALVSRKRIKRGYDELVAAITAVDGITAQTPLVQRCAAVGQMATAAANAFQHLSEAASELNKASTNAGYAEILADIETDYGNAPSDPIHAAHKAQKDKLATARASILAAVNSAKTGAGANNPEAIAAAKTQVNALGTTLRTAIIAMRDAIAPHLPYTPGSGG